MRQFRCHDCKKQSRFLKRKQKMEFLAEMKLAFPTDETRTYACEHCATENEITQPTGAWDIIDADRQL
jgi:DNA-directed RNA polymerase subunit RPC12/RpoP